ncbi:MAG: response regulator [Chloroflexota bacterium]
MQGISILTVDDEPDIVENVSLALGAAGYQVFTAGDGVEALTVLQAHSIHLILADIGMPKMDGYQLYQSVRADPRWATIPFILLTARMLYSDIRYATELGVDNYLVKPVRPADLLAVVRHHLRRQQLPVHIDM